MYSKSCSTASMVEALDLELILLSELARKKAEEQTTKEKDPEAPREQDGTGEEDNSGGTSKEDPSAEGNKGSSETPGETKKDTEDGPESAPGDGDKRKRGELQDDGAGDSGGVGEHDAGVASGEPPGERAAKAPKLDSVQSEAVPAGEQPAGRESEAKAETGAQAKDE